jgi:uncharacterized repeat protein (TIGR01451 family)
VRFNSAVPLTPAVAASGTVVLEDDSHHPNALLDVFLSAPPDGAVTVDYETQDGTAHAGSDYEATAGSLSLGPTALGATVPVPILGDALIEPAETFSLVLSNAIGAPLVSTPGVATILDDDGPKTYLVLNSQPGDYIGGGTSQRLTLADGDFTALGYYGNTVDIQFNGDTFWDTRFAAPAGAVVTPGTYEGATRWPFQESSEPGLDVSGDGRGCNELSGRFVVFEAVYSSGVAQRFAANFEQHCENHPPALFGAIRYNSTVGPTADLATVVYANGLAGAGEILSMVVTVTNNGPDDVSGASVTWSTNPALSSVNWTCFGSGGASCAASGSGALPLLVLPSNGTATLTIQGRVPADAAGTLTVSASAAPPPGAIDWNHGNDASSGSFFVVPNSDLAITKSDGRSAVALGQAVTYVIVASNNGPVTVMGATVTDAVPPALTGVSWSCVPSAGATCAASGTGNINDPVILPAGASVTYTVMATLDPSATGVLLNNTASISVPSGVFDGDRGNNSATDSDAIVALSPRNDTPTSAKDLAPGSTSSDVLGPAPDDHNWFRFQTRAGRSYCVEVDNGESETSIRDTALSVYRADAVTLIRGNDDVSDEPSAPLLSRVCYRAPATEYNLADVRPGAGGVAGAFRLRIVETTSFAPWFFSGNGFDAFVLVKNTTSEAHSATITLYGANGAVLGTRTAVVPANGTDTVMVSAPPPQGFGLSSASGGVAIAHDGPPGAVMATITSVNFGSGVSFDTPASPRQDRR